jgi:hypothetical protein
MGGRPPYLSDADVQEFRKTVNERAQTINCITKSEALSFAFHLRQQQVQNARQLLTLINCPGLADRLLAMYPPVEPDDQTIRTICRQVDLAICRPQTLELARRMFCDYDRIANFVVKFSELFQRNSRLIWKADETRPNAAKRFKVICQRQQLPAVTVLEHGPHLTGMVSTSGGGVVLEPIAIMKSLQH